MPGLVGRGFSRDIKCLPTNRALAPEELLLTFSAASQEAGALVYPEPRRAPAHV